MDSVFRLLLRLLLVPTGYFAGVVAGAMVILIGEWRIGSLVDVATPDEAALGWVVALVSGALIIGLLLSTFWLVAAVGILFSEAFAVRSWIFHAANGVISSWIGTQVFGAGADAPTIVHDPFYVVAAGLAGGLTYWLVAGSTAGFWQPVLRSAADRAGRLGGPTAPMEVIPPPPVAPGPGERPASDVHR